MATSMDCRYVSCGCNRVPHCVDWGRNSLICYGACHAVVICQSEEALNATHTLTGHQGRVNCVRWIHKHRNEPENELVSCSSDKTVKLWRGVDGQFQIGATLSGHTGAVTVVGATYLPNSDGFYGEKPHTVIASASVDSTLKIWERQENEDDFTCIQTLTFGSGFILDLTWVVLPGTNIPLLACGGDDQKVHLIAKEDEAYVTVQKLVGHEDWLRCMEFTITDEGDILLASCAQDCFIRLWRLSWRNPEEKQNVDVTELAHGQDIQLKENTFTFTSHGRKYRYAVILESVLQGHENWIYSIHWQPAQQATAGGDCHQAMRLLSASMDKTLIIWRPEEQTGVWMEQVRVGEVGGNTLGFYGGVWGHDGKTILGHGYQGAFHMWHQQADSDSWLPGVTMGGHFDAVQDIIWDPEGGQFLLSASTDQTTRVHGYWSADKPSHCGWHEIARPQVHGYDMQCIAPIGRYAFISGADEKVLRMFDAPRNFIENAGRICKMDVMAALEQKGEGSGPEGASVPALGLSNKAVFQGESQIREGTPSANGNDQYLDAYFSPLCLQEPPSEGNLLQNTLWPEMQKLYGHGYEVFAVASHPKKICVASSCKAAKAQHAAIILWDAVTWRQVCSLVSHSLTITQLEFSHSGEYLLSVSRDRTWSIFRHRQSSQPQTDPLYSRVAFSDKSTAIHARIIWGCAWSHDDKYFITVSRDKKAVIWGESDNEATNCLANYRAHSTPLLLPDSITAVDFAPVLLDKQYLLAFGLENGSILLYKWDASGTGNEAWTACLQLQQQHAHHLTVKKIKFCPYLGDPEVKVKGQGDGSRRLQLASCGADHIVKIYSVDIDKL